jgi:hypothetical protein
MAQFTGSPYRFRYEGHSLIGEVDPSKMRDSKGLVVLRDPTTGELFPIRHIHIFEVLLSGQIMVVRFHVGSFPDSDQLNAAARIRAMVTRLSKVNLPNSSLYPLIYEIEDEVLNELENNGTAGADQSFRWRSVIETLRASPGMQDCGYLHLRKITDERGEEEESTDDDGQLAVDADSAYKLEVLSYVLLMSSTSPTQDVVEEATLAMAVDEKLVTPLVGESSIVSRYDDHILSFRTLTTPGGNSTHIRLLVKRKEVTGTAQFPYFPNIDLDLSMRFSNWQWVSAGVGSVLLGVGWIFVPKYSDILAKLLQAVGVLMFSAPGKDFYGFWANRLIKSRPVKELTRQMRQVHSTSGSGDVN